MGVPNLRSSSGVVRGGIALSNRLETETLVIGAGPSGLACAKVLADANEDVIVADIGDVHPRRGPVDGVGGAGLYSDGKFSFYPAGTAVWRLRPTSHMKSASNYIQGLLAENGVPGAPLWSDHWSNNDVEDVGRSEIHKFYPSIYADLETRVELIATLARGAGKLLTNSHIESLARTDGLYHAIVDRDGRKETISAQRVVLASGRLWRHGLDHPFPTVYRRYEVGVRIQQDAEDFVFAGSSELDPKWIYRHLEPRREYRTFCCCRNGNIVEAQTRAGILLSGRADGEHTAQSNFGLMVRYLDPIDEEWRGSQSPFTIRATDFLANPTVLADRYGDRFPLDLAEALRNVCESTGMVLTDTTTLHGPCLEGVGHYVQASSRDLRVEGQSAAWVTGDASGQFRGLVPALVSGAFVGLSIIDDRQVERRNGTGHDESD